MRLRVVGLHQPVGSNAFHQAFLRGGATPRPDGHLLRHASGKTTRPALAWMLSDYFLDRLCGNEVRVGTCVVCKERLACWHQGDCNAKTSPGSQRAGTVSSCGR